MKAATFFTKIILFSYVLFIAGYSEAFAQDSDPATKPANQHIPGQNPGMKNENQYGKESKKINYLIERLKLDDKEKESFPQVYLEYRTKIDQTRRMSRKDVVRTLNDSVKITEKEIDKLAEDELASREKEIELYKQYRTKFDSLIGKKKTAQLYFFEDKFSEDILRNAKRNEERENKHKKGKPIAPGMKTKTVPTPQPK